MEVRQIRLKNVPVMRARVISHALKDLVLESSNVIIMGHRAPDMDAIGAAIGILKVAQLNERKDILC